MDLVDKQHNHIFRLLNLFQHPFHTLLELSTEFAASNERANIEREQLAGGKVCRDVGIDDSRCQTLNDSGFTDSGFADKHRVILRTPRQYSNYSTNFLLSPNDRIYLSFSC